MKGSSKSNPFCLAVRLNPKRKLLLDKTVRGPTRALIEDDRCHGKCILQTGTIDHIKS